MRVPKDTFKYTIGAIAAIVPLMIVALVVFLTYLIWSSNNVPQESVHQLAFSAALLITIFVLLVTVAARVSLHLFSSKQH